MAPKVASAKSKAAADKKQWSTTWHMKQVDELKDQKAALMKAAKDLAKQKRSIQQKHRRLKKKASSVNLDELMDLCLLKATVMQKRKFQEDTASGSGSSSSSADAYIPKDGEEAMSMIAAQLKAEKKTTDDSTEGEQEEAPQE